MANKYLDLTGVETLWSAIKSADDSVKTDLTALINSIKAKSGSSIGYDSKRNEMFLKDSDGNEIANSRFDAKVFVKDDVLDKVEIIETSEELKVTYGKDAEGKDIVWDGERKAKFIEFTWNVENGEKKSYLKIDEIGKTYEEDAIKSIVISTDNKLSVNHVGSDKTKTSEAISIVGGPFASVLSKAFGSSIPANTSLQDILMKLACTELWPDGKDGRATATASVTDLSSSIAAPTFTAGDLKTNDTYLVKVGSSINIGAVSTSKASYGLPSVSYSGFTWGYATSTATDAVKYKDVNPSSVTGSVTTASNVTYTLSRSVVGFTGAPTESITAVDAAPSAAATTGVAIKGTNSISFTLAVDKIVHTGSLQNATTYYALSNLYNTNDESGAVKIINSINKTYAGSKPTSKSTSTYKAIGVYPLYSNAKFAVVNNTGGNNETAYKTAGSTDSTFGEKLTAYTNGSSKFYAYMAFGKGGFTIKLPSGWKIASGKTKSDTKDNVFDGTMTVPTASTETITVAGTATDVYNVYTFSVDAGNVALLEIVKA